MSLWGIAWLTCLCGSMEDAWRQNGRLALERNSLGSCIPMIAFVVWDVENMWLQNNLIWISSCREIKGAWVLRNKKTGKFYARWQSFHGTFYSHDKATTITLP